METENIKDVELSVSEDRILIRQVGQGVWRRPVVDELGNFFSSLKAAASMTDNHVHAIRKGIETNTRVNDRLFAWALEKEIMQNVTVVRRTKGKPALFTPAPLPAAPAPSRFAPPPPPLPLPPPSSNLSPFLGVRWPDGSVTVRLAAKNSWSLTRSSEAEVPTEIVLNTVWLRG